MNHSNIILILMGIVILLLLLFNVPLGYVQIGKKVKKGTKLTYGIISFVKERLFVSDDVVERFNWFIEELDHYVNYSYTTSLTSMWREIRGKTKLTKMESKYLSDKVQNLSDRYLLIQQTGKLGRKKIFRETVKKFKELVVDVSRMARGISRAVDEKTFDPSRLKEDFQNRYGFGARQFNIYLVSFRRYLDRTFCFHNIEIEYHRLRQLLISEEIEFPKEVRVRL